MRLIADLHIHSHFSRATSGNLTFEHLARWAQLKGIQVVGTGDIAHPGWLAEMREKLAPAEDGLFRLKDDFAAAVQTQVPPACQAPVRFILGGEISNIYKRGDRTRKVHNVVFAPSFDAVERLQARLERIGNIRSDGRPILGLDSRDLLEIVLDVDPTCHLIPAHIWTPWFSLLGSKSGFDSVEECYADLTPHIFALETGLSSDPPMNWRVSALDRYALVSNSDAHSPEKLGREGNLFDCELVYGAIFDALKRAASLPSPAHGSGPFATLQGGFARAGGEGFLGTIEFFPEEGKYHFDGHRACGIAWDPPTTLAHNGLCSVCGKPVTVGVMHRVELLADRPEGGRPVHTLPFHSLIPLPEVLGQAYDVGAGSKRVAAEYLKLLGRLGPELVILREVPPEEIAAAGGERLAEGIGCMRRGEVVAEAGYDGEYGVIRVFGGAERQAPETQMGLFGDEPVERRADSVGRGAEVRRGRGAEEQRGGDEAQDLLAAAETPTTHVSTAALHEDAIPYGPLPVTDHVSRVTAGLNPEQRAAVLCTDRPLIIVAGPGTGKTRTLTVRIAYLILEKQVAPENILAITFTNKAAGEMRERLTGLLGDEIASRVTIKTFHAFGAMLLRQHAERLGLSSEFVIVAEEDRAALLRRACPELKTGELEACLAQISAAKALRWEGYADDLRLKSESDTGSPLKQTGEDESASAGLAYQPANSCASPCADIYRRYEAALRESDAVDFDDLILLPIRLLVEHPDVLAAIQARYRWISVDEYQDVNAAQYHLLRMLTSSVASRSEGEANHEDTKTQRQPVEKSASEPSCPGAFVVEGSGSPGANLCVIGDPDQAIYGFRGADHRYFLQFEQDFPGAATLSLNRNYRSSQRILDAAAQVIARNPDRKAVEILAEFADEVKLDVYRAPTDKAEAEYIVHQIEQMVGGTSYFSLDSGRTDGATLASARSFADFAVLYRLSAQSRPLIEAFDRSGIPYQTVGQASLYAHKAVRELLAHLWLLHNPRSRVHLETVLAAGKPAFGVHAMERVWAQVGEASLPLSGTTADLSGDASPLPFAAAASTGFNAAQCARLAALAAFYRELAQGESGWSVARLIERVQQFISEARGEPFSDADVQRLHQLALRAVPFGGRLAAFLESTALQSETDAYDPRADRVTLMSLHASKGLEFPVVFIVGCEEGLLPYERKGEVVDIEEECRLFYVGLTRAGRKLLLTHARKRLLFGQFMENQPSRFVGDIGAALKEVQEMQYRPPEHKPESGQMSLF